MTDIKFRSDFTVNAVSANAWDDDILRAMLTSTSSDDTVATMSDEAKFGRINFLMKNRHGTPFEMTMLRFLVEAPIFVFREWHRHRIGISINEMSGRYVELPPVYYIPGPWRDLVQTGKPGAYEYHPGTKEEHEWLIDDMAEEAKDNYMRYQRRLDRGYAKEVARMSLGINIYSRMYWQANARSLMAFLSLRTRDDRAAFPSKPMWEIDACAQAMEQVMANCMPMTHKAFNDNGRVCP